MKSILICTLLSTFILGGAYIFGAIMSSCNKPKTETPQREFSNYVDKSGYYDTVVFTEEDSILSIY